MKNRICFSRENISVKVVSIVVTILFSINTLAYSAPQISIAEPPAPQEASYAPVDFQIPAEFGSVDEIFQAPESRSFVVHIQDAHGSYDAQKKIEALAKYLTERYGFKLLFLEGAQGKLDPGFFNFFPERERNLEVADILMRKGEFSGAESFLLGTDREVTAYGIENVPAYRDDIGLFRKVIARKDLSGKFSENFEKKLRDSESRMASKPLRDFLNEWRKFSNDRVSLLRFGDLLRRFARESLDLDLKDSRNQTRFPVLLRVLKLKDLESELDREKAEAEKNDLIRILSEMKVDRDRIEAFREIEKERRPRFLLEKICEQTGDKIDFEKYPHFSAYARYLVFRSEIDGPGLFDEITSLSEMLFSELAKTPEEKALVGLEHDLRTIRRLFGLEWTRKEYEAAGARSRELLPSNLMGRLRGVEPGQSFDFPESAEADAIFGDAVEFYKIAEKREAAFQETLLRTLREEKQERAIFITGGFHSEGLRERFKREGISYAEISPRLNWEPESQDIYLNSMLPSEAPEAGSDWAESGAAGTAGLSNVLQLTDLDRQESMSAALGTRIPHIFSAVFEVGKKAGLRFEEVLKRLVSSSFGRQFRRRDSDGRIHLSFGDYGFVYQGKDFTAQAASLGADFGIHATNTASSLGGAFSGAEYLRGRDLSEIRFLHDEFYGEGISLDDSPWDVTAYWNGDGDRVEGPKAGHPAIKTPGHWLNQGYFDTTGIELKKSFEMPAREKGKRYVLHFGGSIYYTEVLINGVRVRTSEGDEVHEGYFMPFEYDITDYVREGRNEITVTVRNPADVPEEQLTEKGAAGLPWFAHKRAITGVLNFHDTKPGGTEHQKLNVGGIWQPVRIIEADERARISAAPMANTTLVPEDMPAEGDDDRRTAQVNISIPVENGTTRSAKAEVLVRFSPENFDGDSRDEVVWTREAEVKPGAQSIEISGILRDAKLWWPWNLGAPNLYRVGIEIREGDELLARRTMRVGVRQLEGAVRGEWRMNGRPFRVLGDNGIPTLTPGNYSREDALRDGELIINANIQLMRVHGHVPHPYFLEVADQLGILIWQDFPLQQFYHWDKEFREAMLRQMPPFVRLSAGSHPSVVLLNVHNEPVYFGANPFGLADPARGTWMHVSRPAEEIDREAVETIRGFLSEEFSAQSGLAPQAGIFILKGTEAEWHPYYGYYYGELFDYLMYPNPKNRNGDLEYDHFDPEWGFVSGAHPDEGVGAISSDSYARLAGGKPFEFGPDEFGAQGLSAYEARLAVRDVLLEKEPGLSGAELQGQIDEAVRKIPWGYLYEPERLPPAERQTDSEKLFSAVIAKLSEHNFHPWTFSKWLKPEKPLEQITLEEVVRAHQDYQAWYAQLASENYRRAGIGQVRFMFMSSQDNDAGQFYSANWSVLGSDRAPKKAYDAVRRAYQPVLASSRIVSQKILPGEKWLNGLWINNDTHREIKGAKIVIELRDSGGGVIKRQEIDKKDIPPFRILSLSALTRIKDGDGNDFWTVGQATSAGEYVLTLSVQDAEGRELSRNIYELKVLPADFLAGLDAETGKQVSAVLRGRFEALDKMFSEELQLEPERADDWWAIVRKLQKSRRARWESWKRQLEGNPELLLDFAEFTPRFPELFEARLRRDSAQKAFQALEQAAPETALELGAAETAYQETLGRTRETLRLTDEDLQLLLGRRGWRVPIPLLYGDEMTSDEWFNELIGELSEIPGTEQTVAAIRQYFNMRSGHWFYREVTMYKALRDQFGSGNVSRGEVLSEAQSLGMSRGDFIKTLALAGLGGAAFQGTGEARSAQAETYVSPSGAVGYRVTRHGVSGEITARTITADLSDKRLAIVPVAHADGNGIPAVASIENIAHDFEKETGLRVEGAGNGGFFDIQTGVPIGFLLRDGDIQFFNVPQPHRSMIGFTEASAGHPSEILISSPEDRPIYWLDVRAKTGVQTWETQEDQFKVHGVNVSRGKNGFVVYTPIYGKSTRTNRWGTEIIVERTTRTRADGSTAVWHEVTGIREGQGNSEIPKDGFVISLHGKSAAHAKYFPIGAKVGRRWTLPPEWEKRGVVHGLMAGPRLLMDGAVHVTAEEERFTVPSDDRMVLATTPEGKAKLIWLHSDRGNISFHNAAEIVKGMGAYQAITLDGGSSRAELVKLRRRGGEDRVSHAGRLVPNAIMIAVRPKAVETEILSPSEGTSIVSERTLFWAASSRENEPGLVDATAIGLIVPIGIAWGLIKIIRRRMALAAGEKGASLGQTTELAAEQAAQLKAALESGLDRINIHPFDDSLKADFIEAVLADEDFSRIFYSAMVRGFSVTGAQGDLRLSDEKLRYVTMNILRKALGLRLIARKTPIDAVDESDLLGAVRITVAFIRPAGFTVRPERISARLQTGSIPDVLGSPQKTATLLRNAAGALQAGSLGAERQEFIDFEIRLLDRMQAVLTRKPQPFLRSLVDHLVQKGFLTFRQIDSAQTVLIEEAAESRLGERLAAETPDDETLSQKITLTLADIRSQKIRATPRQIEALERAVSQFRSRGRMVPGTRETARGILRTLLAPSARRQALADLSGQAADFESDLWKVRAAERALIEFVRLANEGTIPANQWEYEELVDIQAEGLSTEESAAIWEAMNPDEREFAEGPLGAEQHGRMEKAIALLSRLQRRFLADEMLERLSGGAALGSREEISGTPAEAIIPEEFHGPRIILPEGDEASSLGAEGAEANLGGQFQSRVILQNFRDNGIHAPKAVFVLLPVKDGAEKIVTWLQRYLQDLSALDPDEWHYEFFICSNGSTDDTFDVMRQIQAQYRREGVHITFINEPQNVGKNTAVNYLFSEAKKRYREIKAQHPDFKAYLHFADDDAYPVRDTSPQEERLRDYPPGLARSQIGRNIALLEDPELATSRTGRALKIVGTTPIAPPLVFNPKWTPRRFWKNPAGIGDYFRKLWHYFFQKITNVRKADYGIPLVQIYGQSYTINVEDFPSLPPDLTYDDCYLSAYFFPQGVSTNPDALHEHAEPDGWRIFRDRYLRDYRHREELDEYFKYDPNLLQQFMRFRAAREQSHQRLTEEILRRNRPFSAARFFLKVNELMKDFLEWRFIIAQALLKYIPVFIRFFLNRKYTDVRTMVRGTNLGNVELIKPDGNHYGVVTRDRIIYTDREALWETIAAVGLDTNFDQQLHIGEIARKIGTEENLSEEDRRHLREVLGEIWVQAGRREDEPMSVLDFALALRISAPKPAGWAFLGEFFLRRNLFLLHHAIHQNKDWVLAYTAMVRLLDFIRQTDRPDVLQSIVDVSRKAHTSLGEGMTVKLSPIVTRAVLNRAAELGATINVCDRNLRIERRLGEAVWRVTDADQKTGESFILTLSLPEEHRRMTVLHQNDPRHFVRSAGCDADIGLRLSQDVGGRPFYVPLGEDLTIPEFLRLVIEVGHAVQTMHRQGLIHGDLRRPNALVVDQEDGTPRVLMANSGAFEWQNEMTPQTDIFGLGSLLYYAFTQRDANMTGQYTPIPFIPDELDWILRKALERLPSGERYASMDELVSDLQGFLESFEKRDGFAQGAVDYFNGHFPASVSVAWDAGQFTVSFKSPETVLDGSQLIRLLEIQRGPSPWAHIRIAERILINYLGLHPEQSKAVLELARDAGIFLEPAVSRALLRGLREGHFELKIGDATYSIEEEFSPIVYRAVDRETGESWILKVADVQEYTYTRAAVPNLIHPGAGFDSLLGTMVVRFIPEEFLPENYLENPGSLSEVLGRFAEAAHAADTINREQNLIHRDLLSNNLRYDATESIIPGSRVVPMDFGLSEPIEETTARVDTMWLGQELYHILGGQRRWLPAIYRFRSVSGGPSSLPIPIIPSSLNALIGAAVRRQISAGEFAQFLDQERTDIVRQESRLRAAFETESVGDLLRSALHRTDETSPAAAGEAQERITDLHHVIGPELTEPPSSGPGDVNASSLGDVARQGKILDLAAIERTLRETQRHFPRLRREFLRRGVDAPEPLSDEEVVNLMNAYRHLDGLLADGRELTEEDLMQFNLLSRGEEHHNRVAYARRIFGEGIPPVMRWFRRYANGFPFTAAAGIYAKALSDPKLWDDGNRRTGALWMSAILVAAGYPPFVLSLENAADYFGLSEEMEYTFRGIWLENLKLLWRAYRFRRFLKDQLDAARDRKFLLPKEEVSAESLGTDKSLQDIFAVGKFDPGHPLVLDGKIRGISSYEDIDGRDLVSFLREARASTGVNRVYFDLDLTVFRSMGYASSSRWFEDTAGEFGVEQTLKWWGNDGHEARQIRNGCFFRLVDENLPGMIRALKEDGFEIIGLTARDLKKDEPRTEVILQKLGVPIDRVLYAGGASNKGRTLDEYEAQNGIQPAVIVEDSFMNLTRLLGDRSHLRGIHYVNPDAYAEDSWSWRDYDAKAEEALRAGEWGQAFEYFYNEVVKLFLLEDISYEDAQKEHARIFRRLVNWPGEKPAGLNSLIRLTAQAKDGRSYLPHHPDARKLRPLRLRPPEGAGPVETASSLGAVPGLNIKWFRALKRAVKAEERKSWEPTEFVPEREEERTLWEDVEDFTSLAYAENLSAPTAGDVLLTNRILKMFYRSTRIVLMNRLRRLGKEDFHGLRRWFKDTALLAGQIALRVDPEQINFKALIRQLVDGGEISDEQAESASQVLQDQKKPVLARLMAGKAVLIYGLEVRFDCLRREFVIERNRTLESLGKEPLVVRPPPKVIISILVYNGWEDTGRLLESLSRMDTPNVEVVVLDNGSSENHFESLRKFAGSSAFQLTLIRGPENLGFDEGHNAVFDYALDERNADCVVALNNDVIADKDFLAALLPQFDEGILDRPVGLAGPVVFNLDGDRLTGTVRSYGGKFPRDALFKTMCIGKNQTEDSLEREMTVDVVFGPCAAFDANTLRLIGGYDPGFFAYGEELDVAARLEEAGIRSRVTRDSKIWHRTGGGTSGGGENSPFVIEHTARNLITIIKRFPSQRDPRSLFRQFLTVANLVLRSFRRAGETRDFKVLASPFAGIFLGILGIHETAQAGRLDWAMRRDAELPREGASLGKQEEIQKRREVLLRILNESGFQMKPLDLAIAASRTGECGRVTEGMVRKDIKDDPRIFSHPNLFLKVEKRSFLLADILWKSETPLDVRGLTEKLNRVREYEKITPLSVFLETLKEPRLYAHPKMDDAEVKDAVKSRRFMLGVLLQRAKARMTIPELIGQLGEEIRYRRIPEDAVDFDIAHTPELFSHPNLDLTGATEPSLAARIVFREVAARIRGIAGDGLHEEAFARDMEKLGELSDGFLYFAVDPEIREILKAEIQDLAYRIVQSYLPPEREEEKIDFWGELEWAALGGEIATGASLGGAPVDFRNLHALSRRLQEKDRELAGQLVMTLGRSVLEPRDFQAIDEYLARARELIGEMRGPIENTLVPLMEAVNANEAIRSLDRLDRDVLLGPLNINLFSFGFSCHDLEQKTAALEDSFRTEPLDVLSVLGIPDAIAQRLEPALDAGRAATTTVLQMADRSVDRKAVEKIAAENDRLKQTQLEIPELASIFRKAQSAEVPAAGISRETSIALLRAAILVLMDQTPLSDITSYTSDRLNIYHLHSLFLKLFSVQSREEAEAVFTAAAISVFGFSRAMLYKVKKNKDGVWTVERELVASSGKFRTSRHLTESVATDEKLRALNYFERALREGEDPILVTPKRSDLLSSGEVSEEQFTKDVAEFGDGHPSRVEELMHVGVYMPASMMDQGPAYLLHLDKWQKALSDTEPDRPEPLFSGERDRQIKLRYLMLTAELLVLVLERLRMDAEVKSVLNMNRSAGHIQTSVHDIKNIIINFIHTVPGPMSEGLRGDLEELRQKLQDSEPLSREFMGETGEWQALLQHARPAFRYRGINPSQLLDETTVTLVEKFFKEMLLALNAEQSQKVAEIVESARTVFAGSHQDLFEMIAYLGDFVAGEITLREKIRGMAEQLRETFDGLQRSFDEIAVIFERLDSMRIGTEYFLEEQQVGMADMRGVYASFRGEVETLRELVSGELQEPAYFIENVDLEAFIPELVQKFAIKTHGDEKTGDPVFAISIREGLLPVLADRYKLRRVLSELFYNGKKYGGSRVEVNIYPEEQGGRQWVRIDFKDSGIGISEEDREKVFGGFFRAANARQAAQGTGLGLSGGRRDVEGMGGELFIAGTALGQGTTFSLRLEASSGASLGDSGEQAEVIRFLEEQKINFDPRFNYRAQKLREKPVTEWNEDDRAEYRALVEESRKAYDWMLGWFRNSPDYESLKGHPPVLLSMEGVVSAVEQGVGPRLTSFHGGLGVLFGEWIRAIAYLGGVTSLNPQSEAPEFLIFIPDYEKGVTVSQVDDFGYPVLDARESLRPGDYGIEYFKDPAKPDQPFQVEVPLYEGAPPVYVRFRLVKVGAIQLIMPSTDFEENRDYGVRKIFEELYKGYTSSRARFEQEWIAGLAAYEFKKKLGIPNGGPAHLNETATFPYLIGLVRDYMEEGYTYDEAMELVGSQVVFFTHTLVSAGIDRFNERGDQALRLGDNIRIYFEKSSKEEVRRQAGDVARWMIHGKSTEIDGRQVQLPGFQKRDQPYSYLPLNFIVRLAHTFGGSVAAVSQLNAIQAGNFFVDEGILSREEVAQRPVIGITNAVDHLFWMIPELCEAMNWEKADLTERTPEAILDSEDPRAGEVIKLLGPDKDVAQALEHGAEFRIDDGNLWRILRENKVKAVEMVRQTVKAQYIRETEKLKKILARKERSPEDLERIARQLHVWRTRWARWIGIPNSEEWVTSWEHLPLSEQEPFIRQLQSSELTHLLDPDLFLSVWARRIVNYKRMLLTVFGKFLPEVESRLRSDYTLSPEELENIIRDMDGKGAFEPFIKLVVEQGVQILFAGKTFSHDGRSSVALLHRVIEHLSKRHPEIQDRVIFLEGYDETKSQYLVRGADNWLNTPKRPLEASGTSGMKVSGGEDEFAPPTGDGWGASGVLDHLNGRVGPVIPDVYSQDHPDLWPKEIKEQHPEMVERYLAAEAENHLRMMAEEAQLFYQADKTEWLRRVRRWVYYTALVYDIRREFTGGIVPSFNAEIPGGPEGSITDLYVNAIRKLEETRAAIAARREAVARGASLGEAFSAEEVVARARNYLLHQLDGSSESLIFQNEVLRTRPLSDSRRENILALIYVFAREIERNENQALLSVLERSLERLEQEKSKLANSVRDLLEIFRVTPVNQALNIRLIQKNLAYQALIWLIRALPKQDVHAHISFSTQPEWIGEQIAGQEEKFKERFQDRVAQIDNDAESPDRETRERGQRQQRTASYQITKYFVEYFRTTGKWPDESIARKEVRDIFDGKPFVGDARPTGTGNARDITVVSDDDFVASVEHAVGQYFRDGVRQVELRFNPYKSYMKEEVEARAAELQAKGKKQEDANSQAMMERLNAMLLMLSEKVSDLEAEANKSYGAGLHPHQVRFVFSLNQVEKPLAEVSQTVDALIQLKQDMNIPYRERLHAIDFSGKEVAEEGYFANPEPWQGILIRAQNAGFKIKFHLGDTTNVRGENEDPATHLENSIGVLKGLRDKGIHLEAIGHGMIFNSIVEQRNSADGARSEVDNTANPEEWQEELRTLAREGVVIEAAPSDFIFGGNRSVYRIFRWREVAGAVPEEERRGRIYQPIVDGNTIMTCTLSQWLTRILLAAPKEENPLTVAELLSKVAPQDEFLAPISLPEAEGSSLGTVAGKEAESDMPRELKTYLAREGRPAFPVVAQAAFYFGDGILFMPGLPLPVLDWAVRRSAEEKATGGIPDKETLAAGQAFSRGELDQAIFEALGIRQGRSLRESMPLIVSENVLQVPRDEVKTTVAEIANHILQAGDLLVVAHGDKKPELFGSLRGLAKARGFRVISRRKELLTKEEVLRLQESFDGEPILLGHLKEGFLNPEMPGQKIALDLKTLKEAGMSPLKILALLRQIGDNPDQFGKIGFRKESGQWIVGSEFVTKIVALYAAQRRIAVAA